jgi:hypothetical protein
MKQYKDDRASLCILLKSHFLELSSLQVLVKAAGNIRRQTIKC